MHTRTHARTHARTNAQDRQTGRSGRAWCRLPKARLAVRLDQWRAGFRELDQQNPAFSPPEPITQEQPVALARDLLAWWTPQWEHAHHSYRNPTLGFCQSSWFIDCCRLTEFKQIFLKMLLSELPSPPVLLWTCEHPCMHIVTAILQLFTFNRMLDLGFEAWNVLVWWNDFVLLSYLNFA